MDPNNNCPRLELLTNVTSPLCPVLDYTPGTYETCRDDFGKQRRVAAQHFLQIFIFYVLCNVTT